MPRAFSISIQSETVAWRPALPCTAPGLADHLGVQRQRLGQRGLARVGVADHGERAPGAGVGHRQNLPPRAPSAAFAGPAQVPLRSRRRSGTGGTRGRARRTDRGQVARRTAGDDLDEPLERREVTGRRGGERLLDQVVARDVRSGSPGPWSRRPDGRTGLRPRAAPTTCRSRPGRATRPQSRIRVAPDAVPETAPGRPASSRPAARRAGEQVDGSPDQALLETRRQPELGAHALRPRPAT